MGLFIGSILIVTFSMVAVALFALWLLNRSAGAAFTDRFRDAEYIVNQHRAPAAWAKPRRGFVWLMQSAPSMLRRRGALPVATGSAVDSAEKVRILKRMDELIRFFEKSPFFEDEETRELLLKELREARASWESQSLAEILGVDENEA